MIYKFIGKPDEKFPQLIPGELYKITVIEVWVDKDDLRHQVAPKIVQPFTCPYSSYETFYKNWKEVK